MKTWKILFLLILILTTSSAKSQFELKTNVLGLANNNYNGMIELLLSDRSGIELEVSYRNTPWIISLSGSEVSNNSFRGLVSYKYYLGAEDPTSGIYFGPYLRLKVAGIENIPVSLDPAYNGQFANPERAKVFNNAVSIGLTGGQKIVFNSNIVLEYYAGIGYNPMNNIEIRDDLAPELEEFILVDTNFFTWPWDFRLGITLGYRFWR